MLLCYCLLYSTGETRWDEPEDFDTSETYGGDRNLNSVDGEYADYEYAGQYEDGFDEQQDY